MPLKRTKEVSVAEDQKDDILHVEGGKPLNGTIKVLSLIHI